MRRCFLLNPTRIRQHQLRVFHQTEKLNIPERIDQTNSLPSPYFPLAIVFKPKLLDPLTGSRVYWEYDGKFLT